MLNDIRIENIISAPIWVTFFFFFFFEVSALLGVRHCPKLQSCVILRKTNDETLKKWQTLILDLIWDPKNFFMGFTSPSS